MNNIYLELIEFISKTPLSYFYLFVFTIFLINYEILLIKSVLFEKFLHLFIDKNTICSGIKNQCKPRYILQLSGEYVQKPYGYFFPINPFNLCFLGNSLKLFFIYPTLLFFILWILNISFSDSSYNWFIIKNLNDHINQENQWAWAAVSTMIPFVLFSILKGKFIYSIFLFSLLSFSFEDESTYLFKVFCFLFIPVYSMSYLTKKIIKINYKSYHESINHFIYIFIFLTFFSLIVTIFGDFVGADINTFMMKFMISITAASTISTFLSGNVIKNDNFTFPISFIFLFVSSFVFYNIVIFIGFVIFSIISYERLSNIIKDKKIIYILFFIIILIFLNINFNDIFYLFCFFILVLFCVCLSWLSISVTCGILFIIKHEYYSIWKNIILIKFNIVLYVFLLSVTSILLNFGSFGLDDKMEFFGLIVKHSSIFNDILNYYWVYILIIISIYFSFTASIYLYLASIYLISGISNTEIRTPWINSFFLTIFIIFNIFNFIFIIYYIYNFQFFIN